MNKIRSIVLKALADETRLSIIEMLASGELCACKILEHFKITQPTLSYHMKILCESGIVNGRREGAWMKYSLNMEAMHEMKTLFENLCNQKVIHTVAVCSIKSPEARI